MSQRISNNSTSNKKKSPNSAFTIFMFLILVVILMFTMGNKLTSTSETLDISNTLSPQPKDFESFKEQKDAQREAKNVHVSTAEDKLGLFIEDYRKSSTTQNKLQYSDITFLNKVNAKAKAEGSELDYQKYARYMSNTLKFYHAVKEFQSATRSVEDYTSKLLSKEQQDIENFAQKNRSTKEWLQFIEE